LESRPEDLWLKDYYISRIDQAVKPSQEAEGYMVVRTSQPLNSTSIMVNNVSRSGGGGFNEDCSLGSGLISSPTRAQHGFLMEHIDNEEEEHMRLRNPKISLPL
jgi:hypothetical protein